MRKKLERSRRLQRLLEVLPGFFSWNLILFLVWGSYWSPLAVAYFVLFFDVYWVYQSINLGITLVIAYLRIQASSRFDWLGEIKQFGDYKKVHHLVIIPNWKEPMRILRRTLRSLVRQDLPKRQITVVLAMEEREEGWEEKARELKTEFGSDFKNFFITAHKLLKSEVIGKASNEAYAAKWVKKKLVDERGYDIDYMTITSCDADHSFHPKHFSCLTYKFLDNPRRYRLFWQPAVQYYNNFWRLPAPSRVVNTFNTVWNTARLVRTDIMVNCQNYSASLKMIDEVGYWDPDVIPEDYRIFFKAFYHYKGKVEVDSVYLPVWGDAAESTSFWRTMRNQYEQFKRWAWGVSDDPYVIKKFFLVKGVSFGEKLVRLLRIMEEHFLWPVNWFVITVGVNIPAIFNPNFSKTIIGYTLPRLASGILTFALVFLVVIMIVDAKQRPKRPKEVPWWRPILIPVEFVLMPIVGFFFQCLPGLDAHTRLMLGKYIEYRVTEKV